MALSCFLWDTSPLQRYQPLVIPATKKRTRVFANMPRNLAMLPPVVIREAVKVAKITETDGQERLLAQWKLHYSLQVERKLGQLGGYRSVRSPKLSGSDTTLSESGGSAFVRGKETEDGTHPRPRRRIRVHTRRRWTHYRLVSQLRRDHARSTRRRGNADERAVIGIVREGGHPTGVPLRRLCRFHASRARNHQSSSFHRLLASAGRLLAGERDSWSNQFSGMALLLEGFPCGVFNVEGGARDAFGPLPAENREAGNSVANSLAPCLFGRRQVPVRALRSFKVANRVRHLSRTSRSADVGRWFSVVCNFLEGSGRTTKLIGTTTFDTLP